MSRGLSAYKGAAHQCWSLSSHRPAPQLSSTPTPGPRPAPRAVIAQREGFPEDAAMLGSTLTSRRPLSTCDNYCHRHLGGLQLGARPQPAPMGPAKGPDSAQGSF